MSRPPPANYGVVRDPSEPIIHVAWDCRPGRLLTGYGLAAGRAAGLWVLAVSLAMIFARCGA